MWLGDTFCDRSNKAVSSLGQRLDEFRRVRPIA